MCAQSTSVYSQAPLPRYAAVWFASLLTDHYIRRQPQLAQLPFALTIKQHGQLVITAASAAARAQGVAPHMTLADARVLEPRLQAFDFDPALPEKLLTALGHWCIRYSPTVAIDPPDGLLIEATGLAHLWGGEGGYVQHLTERLRQLGFRVQVALADTVGAAWSLSRYGRCPQVVPAGATLQALLPLPPQALRIDEAVVQRLHKLGLKQIKNLVGMQPSVLRRRFGPQLQWRLNQALGHEPEVLNPLVPPQPWQVRMPLLEAVATAAGIERAVTQLLTELCQRLEAEQMGLRHCVLKAWRLDHDLQELSIGTSRPSRSVPHLMRLFELKLGSLQPDLGFELFVLEAPVVEPLTAQQQALWDNHQSQHQWQVAQLLDRIAGRAGPQAIHRYLPAEHYWPERSFKEASSLHEEPATPWPRHLPRPICLLPAPELIKVTVPLPDYPPINFRYQGQLHQVARADGPERIEQEWWLSQGLYRDYYCLEDQQGMRYWIFRLGAYDEQKEPQWFVHGFFA